MINCTAVGVDIAKSVFQVHYVDQETGEIVNKPIKRAKFLEFFVNRAPCVIGMEACSGAHHWARQLTKMGHEVKLMAAEFVKAFNIRNKNDAADARAIWLAVQQPGKAVAVKTEMQQAMLALHRMRQQLIKFRTMQINGLRGLLTEYGEVMSKSRVKLDKEIPEVLGRVSALRLGQRSADRIFDRRRAELACMILSEKKEGSAAVRRRGQMKLTRHSWRVDREVSTSVTIDAQREEAQHRPGPMRSSRRPFRLDKPPQ